jgi:hypothetical protein
MKETDRQLPDARTGHHSSTPHPLSGRLGATALPSVENAGASIQPGRRCTRRPTFHVKRWLHLQARVSRSPCAILAECASEGEGAQTIHAQDHNAAQEHAASWSPRRSPVSNPVGLPKGSRRRRRRHWREPEPGSRIHHGRGRDRRVGLGAVRSGSARLAAPHHGPRATHDPRAADAADILPTCSPPLAGHCLLGEAAGFAATANARTLTVPQE